MSFLETITRYCTKVLAFVAGLSLAAMVLLTCANILSRLVWLPIRGTFELLGMFGAVAASFALAYTQAHRMHIAVDILVDRFASRTRRVLTIINGLFCMTFFGLAAWQIVMWSNVLVEEGELTETLQIPFYPFTYATALGCAVLALIFLTEILRLFFPKPQEDDQ